MTVKQTEKETKKERERVKRRREKEEREGGRERGRERKKERKRFSTINTLINPSCCLTLMRHSFTASSGSSVGGGWGEWIMSNNTPVPT